MVGPRGMHWREARARHAYPQQRKAGSLRSIAEHIGVVEFSWAILAYFILRFAFGGFVLGILIGAIALVAILRFQPAYYLKLRVVIWLPVIGLLVFALSLTVLRGDAAQATYLTWLIAALWLQILGPSFFQTTSPQKTRTIAIAFLILLIPFVVAPGLQDMGTAVPAVRTGLVLDDAQAPRAFFFHSGELGMFAAGLLVLVSTSHQFEGRASRSLEVGILAALAVVVLWSQSTAGLIIASFAIAMRLLPWAPSNFLSVQILIGIRRSIAFLPIIAVSLLAVTQLAFAPAIENSLGAGSLWWRYVMAEDITQHAQVLEFSPHLISTLISWPHSVFLDFLLMFGWAGVFLLILEIGMSWILVRRGSAWPALFWAVAAVMPIGAGPVYLMLAAVFSYAHVANWRTSAGLLQHPQPPQQQRNRSNARRTAFQ